MTKKHNFIWGTFILTSASFLSRFIGFYFRIFLSRIFSEEQIGLYQLIFPIYALAFSLTSAGIELALSRTVAKEISHGKRESAAFFFYISLFLSILLSCSCMKLLQKNAGLISIYILGDMRSEALISSIAYALPFAGIHSCVCGYYLGLKQAKVSAISQLLEQLIRVTTALLLCQMTPNIISAVHGIVLSEFFTALFCVWYYARKDFCLTPRNYLLQLPQFFKELLALSLPITANRILTNLLQSTESISIPLSLQKYGYTAAEALGSLGVLTGMALPCILFPSAITNSLAMLVLPAVAECQSTQNKVTLRRMIQKIASFCFLIGSVSCLFFFIFSSSIGKLIFKNSATSDYLKVLCWICPFLYSNTTLSSIINGLGKTSVSFLINCLAISIRIISILFFVPQIGINGYLWGLLLSQLLSFSLQILYLIKQRGC